MKKSIAVLGLGKYGTSIALELDVYKRQLHPKLRLYV